MYPYCVIQYLATHLHVCCQLSHWQAQSQHSTQKHLNKNNTLTDLEKNSPNYWFNNNNKTTLFLCLCTFNHYQMFQHANPSHNLQYNFPPAKQKSRSCQVRHMHWHGGKSYLFLWRPQPPSFPITSVFCSITYWWRLGQGCAGQPDHDCSTGRRTQNALIRCLRWNRCHIDHSLII